MQPISTRNGPELARLRPRPVLEEADDRVEAAQVRREQRRIRGVEPRLVVDQPARQRHEAEHQQAVRRVPGRAPREQKPGEQEVRRWIHQATERREIRRVQAHRQHQHHQHHRYAFGDQRRCSARLRQCGSSGVSVPSDAVERLQVPFHFHSALSLIPGARQMSASVHLRSVYLIECEWPILCV